MRMTYMTMGAASFTEVQMPYQCLHQEEREMEGGREDGKAVHLYLVNPTPRHDMMVTGPVLNRSFAGNHICPKFESAMSAMPGRQRSVPP